MSTMAEDVLLVDSPVFGDHTPLAYHPERPERLTAARAALASSGLSFRPVQPRPASEAELLRVHDASYLARLAEASGRSGNLDADTYVSPKSVDTARIAAGSVTELVDQLVRGEARRGVALVRPPGHHARRSSAMGFCLLNNVAVAAAHARAAGLSRVAILDWDVHHGNGTQEIFLDDPQVLYASLHQYPFYPGTGAVEETGKGDGTGFTVNVPLSAGAGDAIYKSAFERVVLPVLDDYKPELVLVSAGFDAATRDPLAGMDVSATAFGWMTRGLTALAEKHASGRIALVLEGGYDLPSIEAGLGASLRALVSTDDVPIAAPADDVEVRRAAKVARRTWKTAG
jgi:acetoin utilization deacetylase AcuC-like enzyme